MQFNILDLDGHKRLTSKYLLDGEVPKAMETPLVLDSTFKNFPR